MKRAMGFWLSLLLSSLSPLHGDDLPKESLVLWLNAAHVEGKDGHIDQITDLSGKEHHALRDHDAGQVLEKGRVFTSTIGGAMAGGSDFANEAMRRLFVNACYWTLGMEDKLPTKVDVTPVDATNPFKRGVKPSDAQP